MAQIIPINRYSDFRQFYQYYGNGWFVKITYLDGWITKEFGLLNYYL